MILMMVILSSVPFGIGTTFCKHRRESWTLTLLVYSLINGGAFVALWGWVIMSLITLCIAVSLGEIASRFPVAGGVYYWSFMLAPGGWGPIISWIVGWLSVVGNVIVTLTANFGYA